MNAYFLRDIYRSRQVTRHLLKWNVSWSVSQSVFEQKQQILRIQQWLTYARDHNHLLLQMDSCSFATSKYANDREWLS